MTNYEKLLSECEKVVEVRERNMISDGLYCDGHIWINKDMTSARKACILAEEIGHHMTSVGDIIDQTDIRNRKQEHKARRWAFKTLVPLDDINRAIEHGHSELWEMAEYLEVDEGFLREALRYYGLL